MANTPELGEAILENIILFVWKWNPCCVGYEKHLQRHDRLPCGRIGVKGDEGLEYIYEKKFVLHWDN